MKLFGATVQCVECGRVFDLTDPEDSEEYEYGHDCEVTETEKTLAQVAEGLGF